MYRSKPLPRRRNSGIDALGQFDRGERDDMRGLDLRGVDLSDRGFGHVDFRGSNLEGANLTRTYLEGANLSGVNLKGAQLHATDFYGANLTGADLSNARGYETSFATAKLNEANLTGASLNDVTLDGANLTKAKLRRVDLSGGTAVGAVFDEAQISEADLSSADFSRARFRRASISESSVSASGFRGANFTESDITAVDARRTSFERANFSGALVADCDFSGAKLQGAKIAGVDLSSVTSDYTTSWPRGMAPGVPEEHFKIKPPTSDAFRRWFGKSKVVDSKGRPLVVYHATARGGYTAFRPGSTGIFFTDNIAGVSTYLFRPTERTDDPLLRPNEQYPGIFRSYLRIENPFVLDARGLDWDGLNDPRLPQGTNDTSAIALFARAQGYDGVIVKNVVDSGTLSDYGAELASTIYVVFDPRQIKSAVANDGNYDPNDPDMRRNPRARRMQSAPTAFRPVRR